MKLKYKYRKDLHNKLIAIKKLFNKKNANIISTSSQ